MNWSPILIKFSDLRHTAISGYRSACIASHSPLSHYTRRDTNTNPFLPTSFPSHNCELPGLACFLVHLAATCLLLYSIPINRLRIVWREGGKRLKSHIKGIENDACIMCKLLGIHLKLAWNGFSNYTCLCTQKAMDQCSVRLPITSFLLLTWIKLLLFHSLKWYLYTIIL